MRQRYARLVRLIQLFEVAQRAHQGRLVQYSNEIALLARQESDTLGLAGSSDGFDHFIHRQAMRRLQLAATLRRELQYKTAEETRRLLKAELRLRAASRALKRIDGLLLDHAERQRLEELRLSPSSSPASGKLLRRR